MIKPVPIRLEQRITELGGRAENGLPNFRVMRGCDRFTVIGGRWKKFDAHGNITGEWIGEQRVLKHPEAKDRYIFEMWMAPEYTENEWKAIFTDCIDGQFVEVLGPYPANGEYELIRVIERVYVDEKTKAIRKREFAPLTETLCDALVLTAKLNKELPSKHKVLAAQERREREERAKDARLGDMIENMQRPSWARQQDSEKKRYIIVPGEEKKTSGGIVLCQ